MDSTIIAALIAAIAAIVVAALGRQKADRDSRIEAERLNQLTLLIQIVAADRRRQLEYEAELHELRQSPRQRRIERRGDEDEDEDDYPRSINSIQHSEAKQTGPAPSAHLIVNSDTVQYDPVYLSELQRQHAIQLRTLQTVRARGAATFYSILAFISLVLGSMFAAIATGVVLQIAIAAAGLAGASIGTLLAIGATHVEQRIVQRGIPEPRTPPTGEVA